MLRPIAALVLLLPSALAAQTAPNDPNSPPESFNTTVPAPTTFATEPTVYPVERAPVIDVDRIVVLGFPTYDTDGLTGLSVNEFGTWMAQLFANARLSNPTGEYVAAAFSQTDVNADGVVGTGELALFLKGR